MTELKLKQYLGKSFSTGAAKTIIVTLSTVIFLPLIIKNIGMEKYGLISMTMIFGGMVVVADFGLAKTVTYLLGQDDNRQQPGPIISNALVINIAVLALIGIMLATILAFEVPIFGNEINISNNLKTHIAVVGYILLSLMLMNNFLSAILEAYFLMHYVNIAHTFSSVALNAFIYIVCLATDSIEVILVAPVCAFSVVLFYMLMIVSKKTPCKLSSPALTNIKEMLGLSTRFLSLGIINSLTMPLNKYLLVYITGSSTAIGILDVAIKIAMIASSILNSIAQPLFGVFSSISIDKGRILRIATKVSALLFVMYLAGNIIYMLIGPMLVSLLDSKNSEALYKGSAILLAGLAFIPVSEPFYRALLGTVQLKLATKLKLTLPFLNIAFIFMLYETEAIERISIALSAAALASSLAIVAFGYTALKGKETA